MVFILLRKGKENKNGEAEEDMSNELVTF